MSKNVGIKLEVDGNILPRDVSLGTKIIILVPESCKIVVDVKKYVAECVLKTPIPINFFIGEYRVRDEEHISVFACFPDPCRVKRASNLVHENAVSPPRSKKSTSVNSSVTHLTEPALKRVKFNETPINLMTSSPIPSVSAKDVLTNQGFDQIDESNIRFPIDDTNTRVQQTPLTTKGQSESDNSSEFNKGMIVNESMLFTESQNKKKRRRRHRKKRNAALNSDSDDPAAQSASRATTIATGNMKMEIDEKGTPDANEASYMNNSPNVSSEDLSFKKPHPRSILRNSYSNGVNAAGSRYTNGESQTIRQTPSNLTLPSTPISQRLKTRQDTPILPRILKNPGIFEKAQQNLGSQLRTFDFSSSIIECNESPSSSSLTEGASLTVVDTKKQSVSTEQDDKYYDQLKAINNSSEINIGDVIAFKIIELDETYCPTVSPYKEAVITVKDGNNLTLKYNRNNTIERTGSFEIKDEDYIGDQTDDTQQDFSKLLSVKIVPTP